MSAPIEIDGSSGEGGGQILRTALSLAALTGRPARIHSIRARRKNPGMANRARSLLDRAGLAADIVPRRERGAGPGAGLFLTAEYEKIRAGFSALGAKGKSSESVAEEACDRLLDFHRHDAPVDLHLADQLLLPASLSDGRSAYRVQRVTRHLLTNADIIRRFIPARIDIRGAEDRPGEVEVEGIALVSESRR